MATNLTSEGRQKIAEQLDGGEVVEYEYVTDDGETKTGQGVVCKSNRGGIRILRPNTRKKLLIIKPRSGHTYWKTSAGSTKMKHTVGSQGMVRDTGERANVRYKDMRGGWMTDWELEN